MLSDLDLDLGVDLGVDLDQSALPDRPLPTSELGRVAETLARDIECPESLRARSRRWVRVLREPHVDAWLIGWPAGAGVEPHDHGGSAGAVFVIEGSLAEVVVRPPRARWSGARPSAARPRSEGWRSLTRREAPAGQVLRFEAGHVHGMSNPGSGHAVSLHVYSPPLESMTFFDLADGAVVARQTSWAS